MNNLIVGRNHENNKLRHFNLNDEGKLKIDETGKLTDIYNRQLSILQQLNVMATDLYNNKEAVVSINDYDYKNFTYDIKYLRNQGKCFTVGDGFFRNNITGNHSAFSFLNPSSSGSIAYVYRIKWSYDNEYNDSTTSRLLLLRINSGTPTGGTVETPLNMKFSASDTTSIECRLQPTTTSLSTNALMYLGYEDAPSHSAQSYGTIDFDEHIEIPSGKGLLFNLIAGSSTAYDSRFSCSVFYYELDVNNPEFS